MSERSYDEAASRKESSREVRRKSKSLVRLTTPLKHVYLLINNYCMQTFVLWVWFTVCLFVVLFVCFLFAFTASLRGTPATFCDALNTFYLRLYSVEHLVKDNSDSERGNPLPPLHGLLFPISSKGSFICTTP